MKEIKIKIKVEERWIPHLLGMFKSMEKLGNIGSSRWIKFYSDGDGDFRPKFEFDKSLDVKENKNLEYDAG